MWTDCSLEEACAPNAIFREDPYGRESIQNWDEAIPGLLCDDNYDLKKSMFGGIEIMGFFLGSILLTPFADIFGRKKTNILLILI